MKKLLAATAATCIGLMSPLLSMATPAQAQAQSGFCLSAPGFFELNPSPATESQLKEQGVTLTAKGLPPNAIVHITLTRGDLVKASEIYDNDELPPDSPLVGLPTADRDEIWDDEEIPFSRGIIFTDESGTASFTYGGKDNNDRKLRLPAEFEEYREEIEKEAWNPTLLKSKSGGHTGSYSFRIAVEDPIGYNNILFSLADNKVSAISEDEYKKQWEDRLSDLLKPGMSKDEINELEESLELERINSTSTHACSSFAVGEDEPETPAPSPNPSEDPTTEPSPTPSAEETPTPDPSPSDSSTPEPTPSETPTSTPEPSPTPSESSTPSETPTPEPSESSTPTAASEPKESTPPTPGDSSPSAMPRTGTHIMGALAAAGTLLALGTAITVLSRRRSQRQ